MSEKYIHPTEDPIDVEATEKPLVLDPGHMEYLTDRAVAPLVIEGRDYRSLTPGARPDEDNYPSDPERAARMGPWRDFDEIDLRGWTKSQRESWKRINPETERLVRALVIPLYPPSDSCAILEQIRLDVPRTLSDKGREKSLKFELPSRRFDEWDENGKVERGIEEGYLPADVHPLAQEWLEDSETPLIWTEGIPKGDALLSAALREGLRIVPVSFTGVTMPYRAADKENGLPVRLVRETIDPLEVEGRTVYLAWDADSLTSQMVRRSLTTTARLLDEARATVVIVQVPPESDPKRGVDDYLAARLADGHRSPLQSLLNDHTVTFEELQAMSASFTNDDAGRGQRLAADVRFRRDALYVREDKQWAVYNEETGIWTREQTLAMINRAVALTERDKPRPVVLTADKVDQSDKEALKQAQAADYEAETRAREQHAVYARSRSKVALRAAVDLAATEPDLSVSLAQFDTDPWLLSTPTGAVDLRTGELLPHDPTRRFMKTTTAGYDPDAKCDGFLRFLDHVLDGDHELVAYLQRVVGGLGLIGRVDEEKLIMLTGDGGNGKSVFLETLGRILGDYFVTGSSSMLTGKMTDEQLAHLKGRRLVSVPETGMGQRLDALALKKVASRDTVSARDLFQSRINYEPSHVAIMTTNHLPSLPERDDGTWRRLAIVPFDRKAAELFEGTDLADQIKSESSGILAWMVRGTLAYHNVGLGTAAAVERATARFQKSTDTLGAFLAESCVVDRDVKADRAQFYRHYQNWSIARGDAPWKQNTVLAALQERGILDRDKPAMKSNGKWYWPGIALAADAKAEASASETY